MPVGNVCRIKAFCTLLWMVLRVRACKGGETECMGSIMRICSEDGYWMETECPEGTSCSRSGSSISCSVRPREVGDGDILGSLARSKTRRIQTSGDNEMDSNYSDISDGASEPARRNKRRTGTRTVTVTRSLKQKNGENTYKSTDHDASKNTVTVTKIPNEINLEFSTSPSQGSNPLVYSVIVTSPQSAQSSHGQGAQSVPSSASGNQSGPAQQAGIPIPTFPSPSQSTSSQPGSSPTPQSSPSQSGSQQKPAGQSGSSPTPQSSPSQSGPQQKPAGQSGSSPTPQSSPSQSGSQQKPAGQSGSSPTPQSSPSQSGSQQKPAGQSGSSPTPQSSPSQSGSQQSGSSSSASAQQSSTGQQGSKDQNSSSSGGQIVTEAQLSSAMKTQGFAPNQTYLEAVVKGTNSHFKDKEMAAMFLAQLAHESGGYMHIEEIDCKDTGCPGQYGTGAPGKSYHGRGFIQLSWPDNYKNASNDLGMGDKLYQTPETVAQDPGLAMDVSVWYWDKRVITAPGVSEKKEFGLTTKAINGELECKNNANIDKSKKRYEIYKAIAKEIGVTNLASESGCYTN